MIPACRLCQSNTSFLAENDRICGFDAAGLFTVPNRHCGSLQALLGIATFKAITDNGWNSATIGHDGLFLLLFWQGAGAWVNKAETYAPGVDLRGNLTLRLAEEIIADNTGRVRG